MTRQDELEAKAIELAGRAKEGPPWEKLTDFMKKAYRHNAELALAELEAPKDAEGQPMLPAYACPRCKDVGWIDGVKCLECNPVGLGAPEEEEPETIEEADAKLYGEDWNNPEAKPEESYVGIDEVANDGEESGAIPLNSGTGQPDSDIGSGDTGEPEQPAQPKAKKKARKKSK